MTTRQATSHAFEVDNVRYHDQTKLTPSVCHQMAAQMKLRLKGELCHGGTSAQKRKKGGAMVWVEEELDQSFSLLSFSSFFRSQS